MDETLKQKIDWLLMGGFLTQKGGNSQYAHGLNLDTQMFYSIEKKSVKEKNPETIIQNPHLPLKDIHDNMEILIQI